MKLTVSKKMNSLANSPQLSINAAISRDTKGFLCLYLVKVLSIKQ